jgi:excisionase family DNA binding protein
MKQTEHSSPQFIDLRHAAREYSISVQTLRRWVRSGRLPAFNPFAVRKLLVKRADLEALIAAAQTRAVAPASPRSESGR